MELFMVLIGCIIIEMNLEQEKDLVERAKNSSEAFGELYDMYYDRIFGYALRRSADIDSAKDITSEVFFKALKNIGKFQWQGVPFSYWLYLSPGPKNIPPWNGGFHPEKLSIFPASTPWGTSTGAYP